MNVVLYVNSYLPNIGGREIVVHHLARALQALGHDVRVLGASGWWKHRHLRFDYPVYRYPTLRGMFRHQVRVAELLVDSALHGCDVIHAHATYPAGYAAAKFKRVMSSVPLVITPHGDDIHVVPEIGHGLRLNPTVAKKIKEALGAAEILTSISDGIRRSLVDAGAVPERIRYVPNGVDIGRFQTGVNIDVSALLQLPADAELIVTVGQYNPRKGQDVLVRVMPAVLKVRPNARLVVVGARTEALRPLIEQLGLNKHVVLTGVIPVPTAYRVRRVAGVLPDHLAALYQQSAVYVSAGIDEGAEGLSLAVLEAMAAGLPVVATDISGNRDIVHDAQNGFLVPPQEREVMADRIIRLLANDPLRVRMGTAAKETIQDFGWTSIAKRYVEIYREAREQCWAQRLG